jgi:hypothetical protein
MDDEPLPILRKILPYTSVAVVIAALYVAYTFYSRYSDAQSAKQAAQNKEVERARDTLDRVGDLSQLKITSFYASPGIVTPGGEATICYGVTGAKTVTLDPPVAHVYPALSYCFDSVVKKTTKYTLTIGDGKGHTESQSFEIKTER